MPTRRTFLKQSSLAATGLLLFRSPQSYKKKSPIGLQLYTLRDEVARDLPGTLRKIAAIGFSNIEVFGYKEGQYFGLSGKDFAALLANNGLVSPSGHYSLPEYFEKGEGDSLKRAVDESLALSHTYFTIPWLPENLRTKLDDYKALAGHLNEAGRIVKQAGMKLAYHNHNFEFQDWGGGKTGFDILLAETDPEIVHFEMDIYWVSKAGVDPIELIKAHPGRFNMWHVKDMDSTPEKSFTEVGSGVINYKEIFRYKKESGMKYFFVEQDQVKIPVYESIEKSFRYIQQNILHS